MVYTNGETIAAYPATCRRIIVAEMQKRRGSAPSSSDIETASEAPNKDGGQPVRA